MDDGSAGNRPGTFDTASVPGPSAGWFPPPASSSEPPPPPPPPRSLLAKRRNRTLRVTGIVVVALIAGLAIGFPIGLLTRASPSASSGAKPTPNSSSSLAKARALYRQALSATSGSPGFHYESVSSGGTGSQTIIGDAGQHGGGQVITLSSAYGGELFTLLLVDGTVYFKGNIPGLEDQLGVPASGAAAVASKWISVKNSDGPYGVVAPGITVADQAKELALTPTSTLPVTLGGGGATRIAGRVPPQNGAPAGTGHLDIDSGSHQPISYVAVVTANGVTISSTATFSAWGTAPTPTVPPGPVAWSTLGASQPPGGYGGTGATPPPSAGA